MVDLWTCICVKSSVNPHLVSGLVHPYQLDESFPTLGLSGVRFHFYSISEIDIPVANSEDPDQMPRSAASDLGLHCLSMSQNIGTLGLYGLSITDLGLQL